MAIDWGFIGGLEGAGMLKGYVPNPDTSTSGVTIATGVDIGQLTPGQINTWPLDDDLKGKLIPYCGLIKAAAVNYLASHPLTITQAECNQLDTVIQSIHAAAVAAAYDKASAVKFEDLPDRPQTVIASVAFQYGDLAKRCPKFWSSVIRQDWVATIAELRSFGDAYGSRRLAEADYLSLSPA